MELHEDGVTLSPANIASPQEGATQEEISTKDDLQIQLIDSTVEPSNNRKRRASGTWSPPSLSQTFPDSFSLACGAYRVKSDLIVRRCTAKFNFGHTLDLASVSEKVLMTPYRPSYGMVMKLDNPRAMAIVRETDASLGADTQFDTLIAARMLTLVLRGNGFPVGMEDFKIVNIMATTTLGFRVRCVEFQRTYPISTYQPSNFPGIVFRPRQLDITLLIYKSGRVIFTDAASCNKIFDAINLLFPVMWMFREL